MPDPEATRTAGAAIGQAMRQWPDSKQVVTLQGPLGAGKTTLCQGLAEALGVTFDQVVSPTFTLVNVYKGLRTIYHLDLYRFGDQPAEEFYGAGLDEYLWQDICLVEWADRLTDDFWPKERLDLEVDYNDAGRWLRARGSTEPAWTLWQAAVNAFGNPE
ncbi:MAG: tRNA (adenosine(37)-N6)-threonylcarbamoyltransferase complex ATPase subunit type 1 TsaE [Deltaproteobacteria bacterium]|nr:tRNA (adenosine(37)-N6)-threonylcarbamoyltransferase complex ATPase subunit type 1 TsaE [Deltaproteobacteria bacterium]